MNRDTYKGMYMATEAIRSRMNEIDKMCDGDYGRAWYELLMALDNTLDEMRQNLEETV